MVEPVILKFPIPTPEEVADSLGVPRSRIKWLRSILREQGGLPPLKRKSRSAKSVATTKARAVAAQANNGKASR